MSLVMCSHTFSSVMGAPKSREIKSDVKTEDFFKVEENEP